MSERIKEDWDYVYAEDFPKPQVGDVWLLRRGLDLEDWPEFLRRVLVKEVTSNLVYTWTMNREKHNFHLDTFHFYYKPSWPEP